MPTYLFALLMTVASTGMVFAASQGNGSATMTGQIVEAACSIATDDVWQEIKFGSIPLREFADGNAPSSKPFNIHLVNCELEKSNGGTWSGVSVTFDGNTVDSNIDQFATSGEGKGVGINITDENGNKAIPGKALPTVKLYENNTDLHFNVHLARNNDNLAVGDLSSFIRFMVAYQ
jgi:type 1 fimbria pilin